MSYFTQLCDLKLITSVCWWVDSVFGPQSQKRGAREEPGGFPTATSHSAADWTPAWTCRPSWLSPPVVSASALSSPVESVCVSAIIVLSWLQSWHNKRTHAHIPGWLFEAWSRTQCCWTCRKWPRCRRGGWVTSCSPWAARCCRSTFSTGATTPTFPARPPNQQSQKNDISNIFAQQKK